MVKRQKRTYNALINKLSAKAFKEYIKHPGIDENVKYLAEWVIGKYELDLEELGFDSLEIRDDIESKTIDLICKKLRSR